MSKEVKYLVSSEVSNRTEHYGRDPAFHQHCIVQEVTNAMILNCSINTSVDFLLAVSDFDSYSSDFLPPSLLAS